MSVFVEWDHNGSLGDVVILRMLEEIWQVMFG